MSINIPIEEISPLHTNCPICLSEHILSENLCITDCNHSFCKNCLDPWFSKGKKECPMCRNTIDYYTHLSERYKLIIKINTIPIRPMINSRNNRLLNAYYRRLFQLMSFGYGLFITGISILTYYYIDSVNDVDKYKRLYQENC